MRFPSLNEQKILFTDLEETLAKEAHERRKKLPKFHDNGARLEHVRNLAASLVSSESSFAGYRTFYVNGYGQALCYEAVRRRGYEAIYSTATGDRASQLCIARIANTAELDSDTVIYCELTGERLESPY